MKKTESKPKASLYIVSLFILFVMLVSGCTGFYQETAVDNDTPDEDVVKTLTLSDGSTYTGTVRYEEPHGEGTLQYRDGGEYTGEFNRGKRHGQGEMTEADGTVYTGEFRNDKKHGEGEYTFPDGKQYIGSFSDDLFHGKGEMIWPDGIRYVGEWKNGEIHGGDTYSWPLREQRLDLNQDTTTESGFFFNGASHSPYVSY